MIRQVLAPPSTVIQRRVDRRGMTLEAISLLILGLLGSIGTAYVATQALSAIPGDTPQLRFEFIGEAIRPVVTIFLVWGWYSVVSHVVANQSRGRGPISRVARTSAWAVVPIAVWYILRSLVTIVLFFGVDFPADPEGLGPGEQLQSILQLGLDDPVYYLTLFTGVLFAGWSWRLLSVAVEKTKNLPTEQARKVAAVPAGTYALYILWTSLQAAGIL